MELQSHLSAGNWILKCARRCLGGSVMELISATTCCGSRERPSVASSFSIRSASCHTVHDNFPLAGVRRKLWHAHFNHSPFPVRNSLLPKDPCLEGSCRIFSCRVTWLFKSARMALIALLFCKFKVLQRLQWLAGGAGSGLTNSVGTETTQNLWFQLKVSPFPFIFGANKQPEASGRAAWKRKGAPTQYGNEPGQQSGLKTCYFCSQLSA